MFQYSVDLPYFFQDHRSTINIIKSSKHVYYNSFFLLHNRLFKKVCVFDVSTPLPFILDEVGFFFALFLHNRIMNIPQEIFTDHYEEIRYTLYPKPTEVENIDKMIPCSNKYSIERTTSMSFQLIHVRHRHCVFTIDESLLDFFLQDRSFFD